MTSSVILINASRLHELPSWVAVVLLAIMAVGVGVIFWVRQ